MKKTIERNKALLGAFAAFMAIFLLAAWLQVEFSLATDFWYGLVAALIEA